MRNHFVHTDQNNTSRGGVAHRSCVGEERELHALLDVLLEDREGSVRARRRKNDAEVPGSQRLFGALQSCRMQSGWGSVRDRKSQLTPQRTQIKPSTYER